MLDEPQIVDVPAQSIAAIHLTVPRERIQDVMEPGLREVRAVLAEQGIEPAGPWLAHHLRMDPGVFDFEIAVPVAVTVAPAGRVIPAGLPATTVARTVYHGDFGGLHSAWGEFDRWISARGLVAGESLWEVYLTGPESSPDPATWTTQLNRPLVGDVR
jgi:effector-binding domain-containing protein